MIAKLQKWLCPKCGLEWFSIKGKTIFKCKKCGALCNWTENTWKVNEK
jgi:tRNA(Ile2) C34 agmatinyltransferase TiaS